MSRHLLLALVGLLSAASPPRVRAQDEPGHKKPTLSLRATPRMAFSPVTVFLTAELSGGDDVEQFYCPEIVWEWGDGGRSVQESDCTPFDEGVSKIERRFTAEHVFRRAADYTISATLRRAGKNIAKADVKVTVRPGFGGPR